MKSGIVTLIGRSNVGKSTLLNALVGFKVAPVSPKPQTTRLPVQGVLNEEQGQIVFVDTPGIFIKKPDRLTKKVNKHVKESIKDVDLILYVVDPTREIGPEEKRLIAMTKEIERKILVINKTDLHKLEYIQEYEGLADDFLDVIKVSAKTHQHLKTLVKITFNNLPEGEPLYGSEPQQPFDKWVAEMIREKIFHLIHQEIPYSTHVEVENIEERDNGMLYIEANILTTDDKYKSMLIGKKGAKLKSIGTNTRKELELLLQKKIFLDLSVKTDPHWLERI